MSVLESKISSLEAQLRNRLQEIRGSFEQAGVKGDVVEASFRKLLRQFLPRSTGIGHGEIIDTEGRRSKQTDVVVVSDEHPFTFEAEVAGLFFIEGVLAAGEVKTVLESTNLQEALASSRVFRDLIMNPGSGRETPSDTDSKRYYVSPPWFLFALESRLSLDKLQSEMEAFIGGSGWDINKTVDAVFVLDRGWLINLGEGNGLYRLRGEDGELARGWQSKDSESVMFDFLAWLSSVMPRIYWYSPILPRYLTEMYFRV
jgi:hypothetical protein